MFLRQLFDLFAERCHLHSIMQADQVEKQNAEEEDGRRGQDGANQVSDCHQQVTGSGNEENGDSTQHPEP
ncbi:MAG: hypothetical protein OGMRLDGQ_001252, partial [Candidatus Fervidibacter sp.]